MSPRPAHRSGSGSWSGRRATSGVTLKSGAGKENSLLQKELERLTALNDDLAAQLEVKDTTIASLKKQLKGAAPSSDDAELKRKYATLKSTAIKYRDEVCVLDERNSHLEDKCRRITDSAAQMLQVPAQQRLEASL